jgi:hypothetical protein
MPVNKSHKKCNGIELYEWYDNLQYKIKTVKYLRIAVDQTNNDKAKQAYNNNLAYLAGYPLEFLLKIATCVAGDFCKGHIGNPNIDLFNFYRETVQKKQAASLLDITKLRELGLAKFDINQFRYRATYSYKDYGYSNIKELIDDLDKIQKSADQIKKNHLSLFARNT